MKNLKKIVSLLAVTLLGCYLLSCNKNSFNEENALQLQNKLRLIQDSMDLYKQKYLDSLSKTNYRIDYTVTLIDASKASYSSLKSSKSMSSATVKITQGDSIITKTTDGSGIVTFSRLKLGTTNVTIKAGGFSEVNYIVRFVLPIDSSKSGGESRSNIIPMLPIEGISTATIKGQVTYENDLTNALAENVPEGVQVIAKVNMDSEAFSSIISQAEKTDGYLAQIVSWSYNDISLLATTDNSGNFQLKVPATTAGLTYKIEVINFTSNQKIILNSLNADNVYTVQTIPTFFGTGVTTISGIPVSIAAYINIPAPNYTYTMAEANAITINNNELAEVQITDNGMYYINDNSIGYYALKDQNEKTGTDGMVSLDFRNGIVYLAAIGNKGSKYFASVNGQEFTLPYIEEPVLAIPQVDANGQITGISKFVNTGKIYSIENIEAYITSSSGSGAVISLKNPNFDGDNGDFYYLGGSSFVFDKGGAGYKTTDTIKIRVKTGMNKPFKGKVYLSKSQVVAVNMANQGANYIFGRYKILLSGGGREDIDITNNASFDSITGRVININLAKTYDGYISTPKVKFLNYVENRQAIYKINIDSYGSISSLQKLSGGDGYLLNNAPQVSVVPSVENLGSGAVLNPIIIRGELSALNIINKGSGYLAKNYSAGSSLPISINNGLSTNSFDVKASGTTLANIYLGNGKRTK